MKYWQKGSSYHKYCYLPTETWDSNYFMRYLKIYLSYSSTCIKTANKCARADSDPNVFSDINHEASPVDDEFQKQIKERYAINVLL